MSFCVVRNPSGDGKASFDVGRVAKVLLHECGRDGTVFAAVRYHAHIEAGNFECFVRAEDIFDTLQEAQAHAEQLRKDGAQ